MVEIKPAVTKEFHFGYGKKWNWKTRFWLLWPTKTQWKEKNWSWLFRVFHQIQKSFVLDLNERKEAFSVFGRNEFEYQNKSLKLAFFEQFDSLIQEESIE